MITSIHLFLFILQNYFISIYLHEMEISESRLSTFISLALREDIGTGDHSTLAVIPAGVRGEMELLIKENGTLAGMQVAAAILSHLDSDAVFEPYKQDGDKMIKGELAFKVEASIHALLMGERLLLNCMQRMCGIATLTAQYVALLKGYKTQLLDTRKTTPNFRLLEKEAVRIGGARNHRFGLYDMMMLKDNHIDFAGGILPAIFLADKYRSEKKINIPLEVETRNLEDVEMICSHGQGIVQRIMLDNFSPAEVKEAVALIAGRFETEASGGMHLGNIVSYAEAGVDFISVGALIHHAVSLDLSLKAVK
jgi:nicotinate-nucleotide pyrophosphorylase (carboxylating)